MRTTIVESQSLSDATVMVEACYTELLRSGFLLEANTIRGVEIFSSDDVQGALAALKQIHTGDTIADSAVRYAITALEAVNVAGRTLAQVG